MLRKMYLVPADRMQRPLRRKNSVIHTDKKRVKHHTYEKLDNMRQEINEADIRKKTETNAFADILRRVMPTFSYVYKRCFLDTL